MLPAEDKDQRLSSVDHSTKTIQFISTKSFVQSSNRNPKAMHRISLKVIIMVFTDSQNAPS